MKLAIIHFRPIELYPPIHNLLNYLSSEEKDIEVVLYSSRRKISGIEEYPYAIKKNHRVITLTDNAPKWKRLINYLYFNLFTLISLLIYRPQKVLYFQTISSFPVFILKKYFRPKLPIFIHYHEYFSQDHYQKVMRLEQFFHKKEPFLYKKAVWISHTNQDRLKLFTEDHQLDINESKHQTLPNFPPLTWRKLLQKKVKDVSVLKLVYVGALSTTNMYTREVFDWIKRQNGEVTLDVYSINIRPDVFKYLKELNCPFIHFKGGILYDQLPTVLGNYDVGLIIYNGNSLNYTYNAPNKLFEYLACDLDVWFSDDLISSYPYIKANTYPKILKVNFKDLDNFDWEKAINRKSLNYQSSPFFCEKVLPRLTKKLRDW